jgi:hypothetical protein
MYYENTIADGENTLYLILTWENDNVEDSDSTENNAQPPPSFIIYSRLQSCVDEK